MKQRIGMWKYPRWIEFVDSLPKTATGKIQRFKLRAGAEASKALVGRVASFEARSARTSG